MSLTVNTKFGSKKHTGLITLLTGFLDAFRHSSGTMHANWRKDEELYYGYIDTPLDEELERPATNEKNRPEYKTLRIPYTYAAAMTAHTYLSSVFLSRSPVFQVEGRHGSSQMDEVPVETYLDYQLIAGRMKPPLYNWLMDPFRYGVGILGCYWDKEQITVGEIADVKEMLSDILPGLFKSRKQYIERTITAYEGNKVFNVRPFDFIWDTRYSVMDFQKGEFCGERTEISLQTLKTGARNGIYIEANVELLDRMCTGDWDYLHEVGSELAGEEPETLSFLSSFITDWKNKKRTSHAISVVDFYAKIVPKDMGLGPSENLSLWYFCFAEERIVLCARPVDAFHGRFPYNTLGYDIDLYKKSPRSMMRVVEPMEDALNWLINQHFYNVRKHLNNSGIVDPSMVVMKDFYTRTPGGLIRKKPEAFGKDPSFAYFQIPTTDITRAHLQDVRMLEEFSQRLLGVNDNVMGSVNPGGRKTAQEVRVSSSFSTNRLKTLAEWFSATGFSELTRMIISNSQQYMDEPLKLKVAGDVKGNAFTDISPETIAGFYEFAPVDGTLPIDRMAVANMMKELVGQVAQNPMLQQQYDIVAMFEYIAILGGARNIKRFKVQIMPDQQVMQQAQAGQVSPVGPGANPANPQMALGG